MVLPALQGLRVSTTPLTRELRRDQNLKRLIKVASAPSNYSRKNAKFEQETTSSITETTMNDGSATISMMKRITIRKDGLPLKRL